MGRPSEFKLRHHRLVGVPLAEEFHCKPAPEPAQPVGRGASEILFEQPLQMPWGYSASSSQLSGLKILFPGQLLPIFDPQQASTHIIGMFCFFPVAFTSSLVLGPALIAIGAYL
jgi:hypothetical protein